MICTLAPRNKQLVNNLLRLPCICLLFIFGIAVNLCGQILPSSMNPVPIERVISRSSFPIEGGHSPRFRPLYCKNFAFSHDYAIMPSALFCQLERYLERKNGMPIRFRLGDLDKVDQLEGKNRR